MFSSNPYYLLTVTAILDSVILEITKELLFELLSSNKAFLKAYLEFVADNTSILGNKIKHYIKRSIRESIIHYLKQEFQKQNSYTITLSTTKKVIAEGFGIQRTSLSRELKKMQVDGLITVDRKSITINDKRILST